MVVDERVSRCVFFKVCNIRTSNTHVNNGVQLEHFDLCVNLSDLLEVLE